MEAAYSPVVAAHRESAMGVESPMTLSVTSVAEMASVAPAVEDTAEEGHPAFDTER